MTEILSHAPPGLFCIQSSWAHNCVTKPVVLLIEAVTSTLPLFTSPPLPNPTTLKCDSGDDWKMCMELWHSHTSNVPDKMSDYGEIGHVKMTGVLHLLLSALYIHCYYINTCSYLQTGISQCCVVYSYPFQRIRGRSRTLYGALSDVCGYSSS